MTSARVALYIDNSNIFRGCKKSGWRPSYKKVRDYVAASEGPVEAVHFFASEQESPREKQARFYRALRNELGFTFHSHRLAQRKVTCPNCGHVEWVPAEKGVDVGLASQLLIDLIEDSFDTAMVMSSDRDYISAILKVAQVGKIVKIIAWKWTLPRYTIEACQSARVPVIFLESLRDRLEKPQGDVL